MPAEGVTARGADRGRVSGSENCHSSTPSTPVRSQLLHDIRTPSSPVISSKAAIGPKSARAYGALSRTPAQKSVARSMSGVQRPTWPEPARGARRGVGQVLGS
jgi:hypothetical protein